MIYTKTELGQSAMHSRAIPLTPRQRSAFIMFDGKRSLEEVLKMTAGLQVTAEDVQHMVGLGLLAAAAVAATAAVAVAVAVASPESARNADGSPTLSAQEHYQRAYPVAIRLTAGLGLRGFRLNLAVEAAGDITKLQELAPKIKDAVGPEKFLELHRALYD